MPTGSHSGDSERKFLNILLPSLPILKPRWYFVFGSIHSVFIGVQTVKNKNGIHCSKIVITECKTKNNMVEVSSLVTNASWKFGFKVDGKATKGGDPICQINCQYKS